MKSILVFAVLLMLPFLAQASGPYPQDTVPIPTDLNVWGGLSLALIFNRVLIPVLQLLGLFNDDNKKTIGFFLTALGMIIGGIYAFGAAHISDPLQAFTMIISGGLAGVMAVGLHSTSKNGLEWLKKRKA